MFSAFAVKTWKIQTMTNRTSASLAEAAGMSAEMVQAKLEELGMENVREVDLEGSDNEKMTILAFERFYPLNGKIRFDKNTGKVIEARIGQHSNPIIIQPPSQAIPHGFFLCPLSSIVGLIWLQIMEKMRDARPLHKTMHLLSNIGIAIIVGFNIAFGMLVALDFLIP
jgi:hypothetical protein